ncbi:MAG: hypothetical protein CYPHOPRED_005106 [Cyphobasidiales sp. Tagirdzhanova-0007]|nr:MAG: hypothetical protein CYPHOPRED_005106 [Cyphobasidiales sp. Tagirdzhanova-0007]
MAKPSILFVGLPLSEVDPDFRPKLEAMIKDALRNMEEAGYDSKALNVEGSDDQVEKAAIHELTARKWDAVCIGNGIRGNQSELHAVYDKLAQRGLANPPIPNSCVCLEYTVMFEKLVNAVHLHSPHSKFLFNSTPADTLDAAKRQIPV